MKVPQLAPHFLLLIVAVLYIITAINAEPIMSADNITTQKVRSSEDSSSIGSVTSRIARLRGSADWWNRWYLIIGAATVVIAALLGGASAYFQYTAVRRARLLADAEAELGLVKERKLNEDLKGKDLEIARLNHATAGLQVIASDAQARARNAESHLAEANARAAEANAHAKASEALVASADAASKKAVAEVAEAQRASAEASAKTEGFRLDIAKANESAAQAEARATEARLELARFRAPRTLSLDQQKRIASKISGFSKSQSVIVTATPLTVESGAIADGIIASIKPVFPSTGWFQGDSIWPLTKASAVTGVFVFSTQDKRSTAFADALAQALNDEGIVASVSASMSGCDGMPNTNHDDPYCFMVFVVVGTKE